MARQNLTENKAMMLITARHGKHTIHDWRDYLKAHVPELIIPDTNAAELENARKLIRRHRKRNKVADQLLNLIEETEEGGRIEYYKAARETTFSEAKQALTIEFTVCERAHRKFHELLRFLTKKHGSQLELSLDFEIPPLPAPAEPLPI